MWLFSDTFLAMLQNRTCSVNMFASYDCPACGIAAPSSAASGGPISAGSKPAIPPIYCNCHFAGVPSLLLHLLQTNNLRLTMQPTTNRRPLNRPTSPYSCRSTLFSSLRLRRPSWLPAAAPSCAASGGPISAGPKPATPPTVHGWHFTGAPSLLLRFF